MISAGEICLLCRRSESIRRWNQVSLQYSDAKGCRLQLCCVGFGGFCVCFTSETDSQPTSLTGWTWSTDGVWMLLSKSCFLPLCTKALVLWDMCL